MKLYFLPLIIILFLLLVVDVFIYKRLKRSQRWPRLAAKVYLVVSVILYTSFAGMLCIERETASNGTLVAIMWYLFAFYTFSAIKVLSLAVYAFSWFRWLNRYVKSFFRILAAVLALYIVTIAYKGAWVTPYEIEVKNETFTFNRLPEAFDGYKIVLFSDAHLGTYNGDTTFVARFVDEMNRLNPDMICFAGDLVNRKSSEIIPYEGILSRLHAPDGVMAILGNHDYANYTTWRDEKAQIADRQTLKKMERKASWTLLDNDSRLIARGSDTIAVIGTGNFAKPVKLRSNDNKKAYTNYSDDRFKIYLQHNPYAWRHHVLNKSTVDLMLAGHTHAMQMVFEIGGNRFSPAAFDFEEWGGAYREGSQVLYVNTGMGMMGVPMRIGVPPEITVITLKCAP